MRSLLFYSFFFLIVVPCFVCGQSSVARDRYLVLQLTRLGLANRLRTIADMHRAALMSKRLIRIMLLSPAVHENVLLDAQEVTAELETHT